MPELCRFFGIVVRMYAGDHLPPHFHAEYAEHEAQIAISDRRVLGGSLPPRQLRMVAEWAELRQLELDAAWALAVTDHAPGRIDPP
ncbi:MAG: DUF4160 domain-containing protein [Acidimicrobiaceae bacterium]|nr:DUF4160 domain-containing protein [Acidimicrobiaceae bacterium]MDE0318980.1 DUF4160 domain-containing protein [Acidimicrobiaceae bacterium]MDE0498649.1 DUF4160 domain-containing protein [Acidimicrobiaceae bacterium]